MAKSRHHRPIFDSREPSHTTRMIRAESRVLRLEAFLGSIKGKNKLTPADRKRMAKALEEAS